ncbi:AtpZ/AtpI family protein [Bartonella sp. DGB1]|uniref:AtpZ/AtpI family protein n=1 Tax=Bartonella sp. DGB1 TaxID=3239807 RepID=UPI003524563D
MKKNKLTSTTKLTEDKNLSDRLDKLEKNISEFEKEADKKYKFNKKSEKKSSLAGISFGLRLLSEFISAILVGLALGWAFDVFFNSAPWGMFFFLFLGFFAGIFNILRIINNISTSFSALNKLDKDKDIDIK